MIQNWLTKTNDSNWSILMFMYFYSSSQSNLTKKNLKALPRAPRESVEVLFARRLLQ